MKKAIFVGGPDSTKFINNYAHGMREHGVDISAHWFDPTRKKFIPSGVDMIVVNSDAVTPMARDHIRGVCESENVPLVIGCNSVSKTARVMADMGLIPPLDGADTRSRDEDQVIEHRAVEHVDIESGGTAVARIGERVIPIFVDGQKRLTVSGERRATAADVIASWPDVEVRYQTTPVSEDRVEEKVVVTKQQQQKIEEITRVSISADGKVTVNITSTDGDKIVGRRVRPVMWGDEFFTAITRVGDVNGVPAGNLHTYLVSGNPYKGRVLRDATIEEIRAHMAPGSVFEDMRPAVEFSVEVQEDGKVFIRENGGRQNRVFVCPDGQLRMRKDVREQEQGASIRAIDSMVDTGLGGWRNPTRGEVASRWPTAVFEEPTAVAAKAPEPVKTEAPVQPQLPLPAPVATVNVAKPPVMDTEISLSTLLPNGHQANFMAMVVSDTQVLLIPVSAMARALVGEQARVLGSRAEVSTMLQGVVWVRP